MQIKIIIVKQFIAFLRFRYHISICVAIKPRMATKLAKNLKLFYENHNYRNKNRRNNFGALCTPRLSQRFSCNNLTLRENTA